MDNLIKQMRVKFSGIEEGNVGETSRVRDRKIASQKTRSFKGDNRRSGQNWYKGQSSSSRELRYDDDSDHMESDEFRTAVAAAAFAINSAEEQRRRTRRRRDDSLNKSKRKQDHQDGPISVRPRERIQLPSSSSNKMKNKEDDSVPISTPTLLPKNPSELQEKLPRKASRPPGNTGLRDESSRESVGAPRFVMKKTPPPTPAPIDKQSDKTITNTKPESGFASSSHQQPTPPETKIDKKRSQSRLEDIKADVWEKTEMERIKERYEKLNAKILEWENEKKAKAKKKLSRKKDESESKRARALETYKTEMEMIDQIAEGARSQAEGNRRKEVNKVKEKADKIRLTGKIPTKTCLCL
ncbi:hypothetical protein L6452_17890 [Arctium lappa]|uniref:Uncharacterized protein n=1 Tax=Arctium lappa TaxID=4217 RepID=A0ACB9C4X2_ARCLA|nr:hypothetical protein L6452_17890 [Arctium lappa]